MTYPACEDMAKTVAHMLFRDFNFRGFGKLESRSFRGGDPLGRGEIPPHVLNTQEWVQWRGGSPLPLS